MRFVTNFLFGMICVDEWNRYYKMIKNHIFKYLCPGPTFMISLHILLFMRNPCIYRMQEIMDTQCPQSFLLILKSVMQKLNNGYFIMKFVLLPGLVTIFSYQCLLLCWWWTHWHEIPSFPRLWLAYPLSLSPLQLRNKLKAAPSLLYPAEWKFIYDVSSFTFQTPAMTWPLVTKCHEVCQCLCCMDDDTQTAQWWGLMVYVSAVGSAASAWAGRVSITFITCVGQLWDAGLILDWDTLIHTDKFY